MKVNPIISALLRHRWAIDPQHAINAGPFIAGLLSGNELAEVDQLDPEAVSVASGPGKPVSYHNWDEAPEGSVALVRLRGELLKNDALCGPSGMASIGRTIQEADKNNKFVGILLQIDSPGGTVDGTEVLANIVKSVKKPVLTYVDGLMASAAAWIGTGADEIWASTDTDEIGSIGVLMSFADIQPYYERLGVKFHMITASTSKDKVKMFQDVRDGKYEEYQKQVLDVLDKKFMNAVKDNRPKVTQEHLSGKVFFARDVMGILIDRIGSLEEAIQHLTDLGSGSSISKSKNSKIMNKYKFLNQVLGTDSFELVEGHASFNEEQLGQIETSLQTAGSTEQNIADLRDANQLLREENESLKNAAAGGSSKAITKGDATGEDKGEGKDGSVISEKDDYMTGLNKLREEL